MTGEKVIEVVEGYRRFFVEGNYDKIDYPHDELLDGEVHGLEHCHGMLDKIIVFVREGRMEKTFRWLGFIQGVLWVSQVHSLSDLRSHNRP